MDGFTRYLVSAPTHCLGQKTFNLIEVMQTETRAVLSVSVGAARSLLPSVFSYGMGCDEVQTIVLDLKDTSSGPRQLLQLL